MVKSTLAVIPAEAGIQIHHGWTPAFAGVTTLRLHRGVMN